MTRKTLNLTDSLHDYLLSVSLREPEILGRLREETGRLPESNMQIAPEQGQFMALLLRLMGAERGIEVGVYTGYSALACALALPVHGEIIACDISEAWTAIARRYWQRAGVDDRIDLHLGPALGTLRHLIDEEGRAGHFDYAFIDADKENYWQYYEACLVLLRPGGLVMVDNTLWEGKVLASEPAEGSTRAIQAFNRRLVADDRVDISLLPLADGLTLARKR